MWPGSWFLAAAFLAPDSEFLLTDTADNLVERSFLVLELGKLNLFHLIVPVIFVLVICAMDW